MKLKKGDNVIVISGKDKGTTGKIVRSFPGMDKVLIAGVNVKKKHQRSNKGGQKGQIVELASPIHVSNVMIVDADNKRGRVGKKMTGGKYVRINKKTGKNI